MAGSRKILGYFFRQFYVFLQHVFILVLVIIYAITCMTLGVFLRPIIWLLSKIFRPDLQGFVNGLNWCFALKSVGNYPMNILGMAVIDGPVPIELLRKNMENRVLSLGRDKHPEKLLYSALKTYWTDFLGYAFWKEDKNFHLENHVRKYDYTGNLAISSEPSEIAVFNVVGKLMKAQWVERRSPWEILVVDNYKGEGKSVLIIKIDHVLADGLSIYQFFKILTKSDWKLPSHEKNPVVMENWGKFRFGLKTTSNILKSLVKTYGQRKLPLKNFVGRDELIFCASPEISTETVKLIKNYFQVSYAAVIYAGISGTLARAITMAGKNVPQSFSSSVVLPVKNHPGGLRIKTNVVSVKFPLKYQSRKTLLQKIDNHLKEITPTSALTLTAITRSLNFLPPRFIPPLASMVQPINPCTIALANVPVTTSPDFYEGLEILELITATSPILSLDMMISFGGLNNKQRVSFCGKKGFFEDEEIFQKLGKIFADEIQGLLEEIIV